VKNPTPGAQKVHTVIEKGGKTSKSKEPQLTNEQLQRLYRVMVMTRIMDERAIILQRQGDKAGGIGFYVPSTGQEASQIGSAFALKDTDWVYPSYRDPGVFLLRGAPLHQIVSQWYGNADDPTRGRQMPVHYSFRSIHCVSISSPIGTQISQAVGTAMAARMRKDDTVVMTYFGDGATSSNDFHAGMNFAGVYKSPVVFVCENNQWAISAPLCRQTACETIAAKAEAYGMPGVRVDGNDVLAVYRASVEAVERARGGGGPTLIEALTFRMGPHSSSDEPQRYRDPKTLEVWAEKDPIDRFRKYLQQKGVWSEAFDKEVRETARAELKVAVDQAREAPLPAAATLFDDVFREPTPQIEEQRRELLGLEEPATGEQGAFPL
jgi:pyruvate dehydrogenase E1 component alpha subunit